MNPLLKKLNYQTGETIYFIDAPEHLKALWQEFQKESEVFFEENLEVFHL